MTLLTTLSITHIDGDAHLSLRRCRFSPPLPNLESLAPFLLHAISATADQQRSLTLIRLPIAKAVARELATCVSENATDGIWTEGLGSQNKKRSRDLFIWTMLTMDNITMFQAEENKRIKGGVPLGIGPWCVVAVASNEARKET